MNISDFYEKNKLPCVIGIIILAISAIGFIGNHLYQSNQQSVYDIQKCVVIDSPKQFEYELKTNDGFKVALFGILKSDENIGFSFTNKTNDYIFISFNKERYTMHTRTVSTTVNGKTTYRTEVYYTWDTIDSGSVKSNTATMLEQNIIIGDSNFIGAYRIKPDSKIVNGGYERFNFWYPNRAGDFVGNIRYSFSALPNNSAYTLATNIRKNKVLGNVSTDTQKILFVGTKKDLTEHLNNGGKFIAISTILISILASCGLFYKLYYEDYRYYKRYRRW